MSLPQVANYSLPSLHELPPSRVAWTVSAKRAVLLVHDMQQYFVRPFGSSHDAFTEATSNIRALISSCKAQGVPVVYTAQNGSQDQLLRGLQRDFWGEGMPADGIAPLIVRELMPAVGDTVYVKHRYSAFQKSDLELDMRQMERDQIIITGVYAHIGCFMTAADAFMRDIQPFLVADAIADFSRPLHDVALSHAAACCANIATTQQLQESL